MSNLYSLELLGIRQRSRAQADKLQGNASKQHRFASGSMVRFKRSPSVRDTADGEYEVLALLPAIEGGGEFQYHIKSLSESHQRMVKENELEAAP